MGGPITTGHWSKTLWPGLHAIFWNTGNELPPQWPDLFDKFNSKQAYEEELQGTSFPTARQKPQGQPIEFVTDKQGYLVRYTHAVWALGYMVTWEEEINNLYRQVAERRTRNLKFSMNRAKETNAANVYNRGFNVSYPGGDAVALISASHPSAAGLQSNILGGVSAGADLSETAIEDMLIQIMTATDDQGAPIGLQGMSLHIAPALHYEAGRVLKSTLQNNTAANAVNVLKLEGALPKGVKVNRYFTDTDAWFVRTDCPDGMKYFERVGLTFSEDNDFPTKNHLYAAMEYYSFGQTDWRSLYGSQPA